MRITKYTHACVRLEHEAGVLVIDPGIWSEPHALIGADAVLVTHQHTDHVDALRLVGLGVPVYAPEEASRRLAVTGLIAGDSFTVAGFTVRAVGGRHAFVYDGQPDCANLGYVINDDVYHPGDAFYVPDQPIRTLFVPVQGSWMRTSEAIDFVNAIKPERAFAIHEAQINERGLAGINGWLSKETDSGYRYLSPGESS